jgi:hypothetical protein
MKQAPPEHIENEKLDWHINNLTWATAPFTALTLRREPDLLTSL